MLLQKGTCAGEQINKAEAAESSSQPQINKAEAAECPSQAQIGKAEAAENPSQPQPFLLSHLQQVRDGDAARREQPELLKQDSEGRVGASASGVVPDGTVSTEFKCDLN